MTLRGEDSPGTISDPISKSIFEEIGVSQQSPTHRKESDLAEKARVGFSTIRRLHLLKAWFINLAISSRTHLGNIGFVLLGELRTGRAWSPFNFEVSS